jgi:hypothetical protein
VSTAWYGDRDERASDAFRPLVGRGLELSAETGESPGDDVVHSGRRELAVLP